MFRSSIFLATALSLIQNVYVLNYQQFEEFECISGEGWTTNLSVQSKKDENGEWVTSFSACKDYNNSSKTVRLDLKQKVIKIGVKELVHITGVLRDAGDDTIFHKLKFYHKGGKLAIITNDGMTAFRDNAEKQKDLASVFTSRPLKNNELFEIKVDRRIDTIPGWTMGVGVTTHSPETMEIPGWMGQLKTGTWMLYDSVLLFNGSSVNDNYGQGFEKLKPGDRVGVMRTSSGTLHFFINGVDVGIAASDIPYPVYGCVDLIRNILQVTIVDKSPRCPA